MTEPVTIGDATLYLGDCLDIMPTLGKVDAVVTDPPYGVNLKAKQHKWFKSHGAGYESTDDDESIYVRVISGVMDFILATGVRAAITPGQGLLHKYPKPAAMGCVYNRAGTGMSSWGFNCFTPILFYGKCPYLASSRGSRPNSWEQPPNDFSDKNEHPCPKPIGMMNWLVNRATDKNDAVLDPFMGSGTTGVACAKLCRKFIGIEIEPKYFDIACKRIEAAYAQPDMFIEPPAKAKQEVLL